MRGNLRVQEDSTQNRAAIAREIPRFVIVKETAKLFFKCRKEDINEKGSGLVD